MKTFFAMIDRLDATVPPDRAACETSIWAAYGVEMAILALDMSNFSLFVRRNGIIPYLCKIRRMQQVTAPIVAAMSGHAVKYEADNMMAVFPTCADALGAAVKINEVLAEHVGADGDTLAVSIGIDYGRFLMIPGTDCYGDPVNRAYKLGEDIARAGEILITKECRERLGETAPYPFLEEHLSVSGLEMVAFRVQYKPPV